MRRRGIQAYFIAMSGLHRHEISELLGGLKKQVKKATEDELEASQFTFSQYPSLAYPID